MRKSMKKRLVCAIAAVSASALLFQTVPADEMVLNEGAQIGEEVLENEEVPVQDPTPDYDSQYTEAADIPAPEETAVSEAARDVTGEQSEPESDTYEPAAEPETETAAEEADQNDESNDVGEDVNDPVEVSTETSTEASTEKAAEEKIEEESEEEEISGQTEYTDSLAKGDSGDEVVTLQKELIASGYLTVNADGIYGNITETAVKKFQLYNNLPITGTADKDTRNLLESEEALPFTVLWKGARGTAVYSLQNILYSMGYLTVAPDGVFGSYTEAALKNFQSDMGMADPDGGFGNWTFGKLITNMDARPSEDDEESQELKKGDSGQKVRELQEKLVALGYLGLAADGQYGNYTVRAVKKFQLYNNLTITGVADEATQAAISSSETRIYTLKKGDSGAAVLALQNILKDLGYLTVTPDGIFGGKTEKAVMMFQTLNGISNADGMVGNATLEAVFNNPAAPGTSIVTGTISYGTTLVISSSAGALDVNGASVSNGAGIVLTSDTEDYSQKWVMQSADGNYYYIRNLRSWKVLDTDNGTVCQYAQDGSSSQKWQLVENGAGYNLVNADGEYLTASSSGIAVSADASSATAWLLRTVNPGTSLDFTQDGTQWIGIRSFNIYKGNVTETSGYYNINTSIDLPSGGYYLSAGSNYSIGLKVMYVNNYLVSHGYLSWDYYNYERYDYYVASAVQSFQYDNGLTVDGIVGLQTWRAMGYSDEDFYFLGAYTTDLKVYAYGSSREAMITAMLTTADEYASAGTGYRVGSSGAPGTYVDCSGLIYQCLYAAGINPDTNIIDHARVVYEYTSAYLAADGKLGASVSSAQPGDLIFYGGSSVNHVAIYAGNGMIYDSYPGLGVTYRSMYVGTILKIVRVF